MRHFLRHAAIALLALVPFPLGVVEAAEPNARNKAAPHLMRRQNLVGREMNARALLLIILTLLPSPAAAAKIDLLDDGSTISINGPIDADDLIFFINATRQGRGNIATVRLDSPGGSLPDAIQMAMWVKDHQLKTEVDSGATCASACFIIFSAGARKVAGVGARIGVHSVREGKEGGREMPFETVKLARMLRDLGVPESIVGRMVVTTPWQIAWLTQDDLAAMNVTRRDQTAARPPVPRGYDGPLDFTAWGRTVAESMQAEQKKCREGSQDFIPWCNLNGGLVTYLRRKD